MTLTSKIYEDLSEAILLGRFKPGQKLKAEHIKAEFSVSAATVREALNRLLVDGLVVVHDRRGFSVAPFSADDLTDIVRARLLVEVECLADAVKNGDAVWEMNLVAAYHRLGKAEAAMTLASEDSLKELEASNRYFHDCLVAGCNSPTLLAFYRNLFVRHYRYRRFAQRNSTITRHAVSDHKMLLDAALARNVDEATAILREHIMRTQVHVDTLQAEFEKAAKA